MIGQFLRIQLIARQAIQTGSVGNFGQRLSQCFKGAKNTLTIAEIEATLEYVKTESKKVEKHLLSLLANNQVK